MAGKSRGGRERAVAAGEIQHRAVRIDLSVRVRRRIEDLRGDLFNIPPQTRAENPAYGVVLNRWVGTHRCPTAVGC